MRRKNLLILMLATVLAACDESVTGLVGSDEVASVAVAPGDTILVVGQSGQLRATVRAADGSLLENAAVTWQSNDPAVAEVSTMGAVRAVAAGAVQVRATAGGRTGEARVVVALPAVASVDIDQAALDLPEGGELQLADVASVDALGRVVAIRDGTATITVRVHGASASVPVRVRADHLFDLLYTVRAMDGLDEVFRLGLGSGTDPHRIVSMSPWSEQPRLSPDGMRVAFQCMDAFGDRSICVADRDGSNRKLLAWSIGEAYSQATWSHDGTRLAFVHHRYESPGVPGRSRIGVMNADGSDLAIVTGDMSESQNEPTWSPVLPDGSERIAFTSGTSTAQSIWTMKPDGSDRMEVTTTPGVFDAAPDWSPDGHTLVFQRIGNTLFDLRLVDADGSDERALGVSRAGNQVAPAWSPDGRMIAFLSNHETYGAGDATYQIYTTWADGSKLARRTSDDAAKVGPAWLRR
jgi:hypothetical protein